MVIKKDGIKTVKVVGWSQYRRQGLSCAIISSGETSSGPPVHFVRVVRSESQPLGVSAPLSPAAGYDHVGCDARKEGVDEGSAPR